MNRKLKNILTVSLGMIILAGTLSSCSRGSPSTDVTENTETVSETMNTTESALNQTESLTDSVEESNRTHSLFSWKIKIDGKELTVPFEFSELENLGYATEFSHSEDLDGSFTSEYVKNDKGKSFEVVLYNPNSEATPLSQCLVGQLNIACSGNTEPELPDGFVFNSNATPESVTAAYGEPDKTEDNDLYVEMFYEKDSRTGFSFFFFKDKDMVQDNYVLISNYRELLF